MTMTMTMIIKQIAKMPIKNSFINRVCQTCSTGCSWIMIFILLNNEYKSKMQLILRVSDLFQLIFLSFLDLILALYSYIVYYMSDNDEIWKMFLSNLKSHHSISIKKENLKYKITFLLPQHNFSLERDKTHDIKTIEHVFMKTYH